MSSRRAGTAVTSAVVPMGIFLVACGTDAQGPSPPPPPPPASVQTTLYTTLDGPASVTTPAEGAGGGATIITTPANDFVPARVGDGLRADAIGERAQLRQTVDGVQNVENDHGTIEFWYQPLYDSDAVGKYTIVGTGNWQPNNNTRGSIHFGRHNASNNRMLFLILFDANGVRWEHNVTANNYSWNAGDWVLMRITWDMTVASGERNLHLYIDGQEVPLTGEVSRGPQPTRAESANELIYIGSRDATGNIPPNAVYDEVRIWNQAVPPS